jgi:hypothetical protein
MGADERIRPIYAIHMVELQPEIRTYTASAAHQTRSPEAVPKILSYNQQYFHYKLLDCRPQ